MADDASRSRLRSSLPGHIIGQIRSDLAQQGLDEDPEAVAGTFGAFADLPDGFAYDAGRAWHVYAPTAAESEEPQDAEGRA